jgi:hypothetical protein
VSGAAAALQAAAAAALEPLDAAVYPGPPLQGAFPYALVETGAETDWGHKSGAGRELRLAVIVRDTGERPDRVRALAGAAEAMIEAGLEPEGWQIVSLAFLRGRLVADGPSGRPGWTATIEYRARMLASGP